MYEYTNIVGHTMKIQFIDISTKLNFILNLNTQHVPPNGKVQMHNFMCKHLRRTHVGA